MDILQVTSVRKKSNKQLEKTGILGNKPVPVGQFYIKKGRRTKLGKYVGMAVEFTKMALV
jgi:hypothetical protein